MSEQELRQNEAYLLQSKEEVIARTIKGTDSFYYYQLIQLLQDPNVKLSEEANKWLKEYCKFNTQRAQNIRFRHLFFQYDQYLNENNEIARASIVDQINKELFQFYFDHNQPKRIQGGGALATETYAGINKLNSELMDLNIILEGCYSSLANFQNLEPEWYQQLDLKRLAQSEVEIIQEFFQEVDQELSCFHGVPELLHSYVQKQREKNKNFLPDLTTFKKLTLNQMEQCQKLLPALQTDLDFIGQLYLKMFRLDAKEKVQILGKSEKEDRKKQLKSVFEWASNLPPVFESFASQILYELLQIGIELNEYDFDLFLQYLKNPKIIYPNASENNMKKLRQENRQLQTQWYKYHALEVSRWLGDEELISKYVEKYFSKNENITILEVFLDKNYLIKKLNQEKLYKGLELADVTSLFSGSELKQMNDQRLITICQFNKLQFTHFFPISLLVELKNIPQLNVSVFEICTENYYLKNRKEIDQSVNLEGLIAAESNTFEYNEAPIVKSIKEFKFDSITNKEKGVFLIEFVGNGITSKALIRKGRLILKEKITVAGHAFQIIDEYLEVLAGDRTGLWIQNQFYKVDLQTKEVVVPFVSSQQSHQVVIVHNNFSSIGNIILQAEKYDFKASFIYSNESMIMGSKSTILIQPRIYVNCQPSTLEILSDPSVSVTLTNDADIPTTLTFDKLKFNHKQELEIQFQITAKLKFIDINVQAKLDKLHSKQDQKNETKQTTKEIVRQDHRITFNNYQGQQLFCSQFLRRTIDYGYEIYLLGKNGEPKSSVDLDIVMKIKGVINEIRTTLTTDELGKVQLGQLENVVTLQSSVRQIGDINAGAETWNLENSFKIAYPRTIKVARKEIIKLPFHATEVNSKTVSFYQISSQHQTVLENQICKLHIEDRTLVITDLDVGAYVLLIKDYDRPINVQVLDGAIWQNTALIKTKKELVQVERMDRQLILNNVKQVVTEQYTKIKAIIQGKNPELTRVHAIAFQFLPSGSLSQLAQEIQKNIVSDKEKVFNTVRPASSYFNNKLLSDESKYVLDRKNQERYVGNTLEKPQLLLKRQFIRDTDMNQEVLQKEGDYEQNKNLDLCDQEDSSSERGEQKYQDQKKKRPMMAKKITYKSKEKAEKKKMRSASLCAGSLAEVNSFQDFLQNSAQVLANGQPDIEGNVAFRIPNKMYSTVFLIATNNYSVVFDVVPLKYELLQTKDLSQKSMLKNDQFYSIFRNQQVIQEQQSFQIPDLTSTDMQIVDSIEKLFILVKELKNCNGLDFEQENGFNFWAFLKTWNTLDFDQKHTIFDKNQCDELNLFIFFKDRAYFETYVKVYLQNKIEKSFIDYFLLQDRQQLLKLSRNCFFQQLNALEQALLVVYFCELSTFQEDRKVGKSICQSLENQNKLKNVDQDAYKRLFDTVLYAKTAEENVVKRAMKMKANRQESQEFDRQYEDMEEMCYQKADYSQMCMQVQEQCCMEAEMDMDMDCMNNNDDCFEEAENYLDLRQEFKKEFRNIEKTKEYAEQHYLSTKYLEEHQGLVAINGFWIDLAKHSSEHGVFNTTFLSPKFIHCNSNHTEMVAVMALIGLPFETPIHKYTPLEGKGVQINVSSGAMIFTKEIKESKADLKIDILVAQRFFDVNDRYFYSDDDPTEKVEKQISEFIINKIYGCQVIVTNCSITKCNFQVLVEIPSGSIPVFTIDYTKSHNLTLEPYTTQTFEYFFYFPKEGNYDIYPANVSRNDCVVAVAKPNQFKVTKELGKLKLETMVEILSQGSKSDILNFVKSKNILNTNIFNFQDIYYLLKDKDFYLQFTQILRDKHIFDFQTWQYAVYHKDHQSLSELLMSQDLRSFFQIFKYMKCSLFEVSSIRCLEYYPLISQRVHQMQDEKSGILNNQFKEQYINFITYLVEKQEHSVSDKLLFIYYLLLQERINEAIKVFQKIDVKSLPQDGEARLQYDYFTAYLDFYIGFPNFLRAREVCEKYLDCPAIHWRNLFYEIVNQLTEYDGEDERDQKQQLQTNDLKQQNQVNAAKEEILTLSIQGSSFELTHLNLIEVTIQLYKIDLEVLFSRNPFISQSSDNFAFVQPNLTFTHKLLPDIAQRQTYYYQLLYIFISVQKTLIQIPPEFLKFNTFIQVRGGSKIDQGTYFSTTLNVQVLENYGQVKVQDSNGKCLSKVYVKTFAKEKNGNVIFYKDGYTDLRGRMDYASLNPQSLKNVEKFAIFVMSDSLGIDLLFDIIIFKGSCIKEVKAPVTVGKYEVQVQLISRSWNDRAQVTRKLKEESYRAKEQVYQQKHK